MSQMMLGDYVYNGNKLIVKFMGGHLIEGKCDLIQIGNTYISLHSTKYHNSWDDLIPVVTKIAPMCDNNQIRIITSYIIDGNIDKLYDYLISFIISTMSNDKIVAVTSN